MGRKIALGISVFFFMLAAAAGLVTAAFLISHGIPHSRTMTAFAAFVVFVAYGLAAYRLLGAPGRFED